MTAATSLGPTTATRTLRVAAAPAYATRHANPYNALLYSAMSGVEVEEFSLWRLVIAPPDIVHLHWPELTFLSGRRRWRHVVRIAAFSAAMPVARRRGARLLWTVHNPAPHEDRSSGWIRRWYERMLAANVDAILGLTEDGVEAARRALPALAEVPASVTPHGHYRDAYPLGVERTEARRRLGIDQTVTLVVSAGQIRPYKNIPALIDAAVALDDAEPQGSRMLLAVVGRPADDASRADLERRALDSPVIRLQLRQLGDKELALWLRAADLVVVPYRAVQNSGSAVLALSASRPVVVPAMGAMDELADEVGREWVRTYAGGFGPETLAEALLWLRTCGRGDEPDLSGLEWGPIAEQTVGAYRSILE